MNLYPKEIKNELEKVEKVLINTMKSKNISLQSEGIRLIKAGGKRLRPALLINSAKFGEYEEKKILDLASSIELLHLATLVHDDVIDEAELRRGEKSTHQIHGNKVAIFTGDFLVTKAILLVSKYSNEAQSIPNSNYIARILKSICEGEVEQYQSRYDLDVSITKYLKRIKYKTGLLFSLACKLGGQAANCDKKIINYLGNFGMTLGTAFQIQDDLLDFDGNMDKLGKPVLHDIKVGIYTLPVIHALNSSYKEKMKKLLNNSSSQAGLNEVRQVVEECGGIEYTRKLLSIYINRTEKWLKKLPENDYRCYFEEIIGRLISREV